MNIVTVTDRTVTVEPQGLDKLWSLTRRLEFPRNHVRGATFDPEANREPKGIRAPGLQIPGKWAGTFHRDGEKSFWNVSAPDRTIVVELTGEDYDRLYLTVDDPRSVVDRINGLTND
jgi:hypothetical protein